MVILIAVSLVLGDDQCAHHSTGTSITSQGQSDCLLHEPQTSWQCSSSSWSYESLCWAKFSCDSHEKNRILQDVVSFNNCPRNHQFPNAKELKALSFRHTLLVQCWPFLNGRCCRVFLLMRGTTFYTSQKDHIAHQGQEQNNILCIISSHSIEFLWSAYHKKWWVHLQQNLAKTKTCCPVSGSIVGINETLDVSRARTITCPRDTNTCTTQWDGVHLFFKLACFFDEKKQRGDQPWLPESACPPFFSSYPATMSPASKLSWIQSGVVPARNPLISQ